MTRSRASLFLLHGIFCYSFPDHLLLLGDVPTAMPTKRDNMNKKDQHERTEKGEVGGMQSNQGAEHKPEPGKEKQQERDGREGIIGDEDDDWGWSDGELDDERLQAFFDKRPII